MGFLGYIYWNVHPELVHLGPVTIRWYGFFFATLFVAGYLLLRWQFRLEHKNQKDVENVVVYMFVGTLIGARLAHCLFYDPAYYWKHPAEIIALWEGGLASHGGAVGILIAMYLYTRRRQDQPFLWLLDRIVVSAALGGALIRIGNVFNSEILGTATQLPWAFVFQRVDAVPRHPVQLYEAVAYLLIFAVLLNIYRHKREQTPRGLLFGIFLVSTFTARFFLEFFKQPQASYEQNFSISVGQWLSVPFVIAGAVLWWRANGRPATSDAPENPELRV
ncbi:MAG: lgt [Verrucomicrobiales bacterium]|nr:lgt [Verrucomicrobiales bacterium]